MLLTYRVCSVTGIAAKLKKAGYSTHQVRLRVLLQLSSPSPASADRCVVAAVQVGKWDAGMATVDHTPHGRGYDTSFGFFNHDNDYWNEHHTTNHKWSALEVSMVDLYNETETTSWRSNDGPAYGYNSTYRACAAANRGNACGNTGPEKIYEEFRSVSTRLTCVDVCLDCWSDKVIGWDSCTVTCTSPACVLHAMPAGSRLARLRSSTVMPAPAPPPQTSLIHSSSATRRTLCTSPCRCQLKHSMSSA